MSTARQLKEAVLDEFAIGERERAGDEAPGKLNVLASAEASAMVNKDDLECERSMFTPRVAATNASAEGRRPPVTSRTIK
jgi:hypothetical protein